MGSKTIAVFFIFMIFVLNTLPPTYACGACTQPRPPYHRPVHPKNPPHHGGYPKFPPPSRSPPLPPVVVPPIIIRPPPTSPYPGGGGGGGGDGGGGRGGGGGGPGGFPGIPHPQQTCPIDALKLGLCLDVLGGLVHVGIENPVENICCPVIQGLLELEAAICLCTVIKLKLLNLNVFVPLALQVLATCGLTPPPGFLCPPL
ncbi:hypothetical protein L6164_019607 [Bauhinia variegata]|uniref:Uncharacterized protein n=1 Tax=Bauhinia variegata TaxID=167791 RepID=A0ACB9MTY8_BAUVA|nr:hypothetical protein L6164_019607 [Bauhinia variegata]